MEPAETARKLSNAERLALRRAADREGHNQSRRDWYYKNLEKSREIRRQWAAKNKDKCRAGWANRDARRKAAEGHHTQQDIDRIIAAQKFKCAICRSSVRKKYHIDHIHPLARGGTNYPRNIQILCAPCNHSKGAKDPANFMRQRGFLL